VNNGFSSAPISFAKYPWSFSFVFKSGVPLPTSSMDVTCYFFSFKPRFPREEEVSLLPPPCPASAYVFLPSIDLDPLVP